MDGPQIDLACCAVRLSTTFVTALLKCGLHNAGEVVLGPPRTQQHRHTHSVPHTIFIMCVTPRFKCGSSLLRVMDLLWQPVSGLQAATARHQQPRNHWYLLC